MTERDNAPPTRSRVAAVLAAVACAAGCALPLLITAGVLTGATAAVLRQTLLAATAGLAVAALGMWWLHRRRQSASRYAGSGAVTPASGSGTPATTRSGTTPAQYGRS